MFKKHSSSNKSKSTKKQDLIWGTQVWYLSLTTLKMCIICSNYSVWWRFKEVTINFIVVRQVYCPITLIRFSHKSLVISYGHSGPFEQIITVVSMVILLHSEFIIYNSCRNMWSCKKKTQNNRGNPSITTRNVPIY